MGLGCHGPQARPHPSARAFGRRAGVATVHLLPVWPPWPCPVMLHHPPCRSRPLEPGGAGGGGGAPQGGGVSLPLRAPGGRRGTHRTRVLAALWRRPCPPAPGVLLTPQPPAGSGPAPCARGTNCPVLEGRAHRQGVCGLRTAIPVVVILLNFYNAPVIVHGSSFAEKLRFRFQFPRPGLQDPVALSPSLSSLTPRSSFPGFVLYER